MGSPTSTAPLANVAVKNAIFINGSNGSTNFVVANGATAVGYFNNVTVQNNDIRVGFNGLYVLADATAAANGNNLLITGNTINNNILQNGIYEAGIGGTATISNNTIGIVRTTSGTTTTAAAAFGISVSTGSNNTTVSGNTISVKNTATSTTGINYNIGISIGPGATNVSTQVYNNTITEVSGILTYVNSSAIYLGGATANVSIYSNKLSGLKNTMSGNLMQAIVLGTTSTAANTLVYNNLISDVLATGAGQATGIYVYSGAGYKIYSNTVNLNTSNAETGISTALSVLGTNVTAANALDVRNNLFINNKTSGSRFAIYSTSPSTVFGNINYNDYATTGTALGYIGSANKTTLADIQTGFGGNANSLNISPVFVSGTDLHLNTSAPANSGLDNAGVALPEVTMDFAGMPRGSTPDLGGYEFSYLVLATNDVTKNKNNISVYPNPFAETLKISDIKGIKSINVTDLSGRNLKTLSPSNELDLRDLKTGLYVISFQLEDGSRQTVKVIKK
ncbi:hypothetical protein J3D55_000324 [Chryseobacterium ginsenosidimutans]|uniref:T9SS type A sorting domain-containing protein n=1 Tax=Chryseobacterium ginsenosidimutans TaxID=687846 RepID=UPI0021683FEA|nr:T9SS type A sorting domain-containing protein [Chryseobacterium ginsenosidimutans]MCS3867408.1 hypothetical protein [Chryseobacterium ginsenosidimutans]